MLYYSRAFQIFHQEIEGHLDKSNRNIRRQYWNLVPNKIYNQLKGKELIEGYLKTLESRVKKIIEKHSISYWLHVSRRIKPYSLGENKDPMTIMNIRNILNTSIQKYGLLHMCDSIGFSDNVELKDIFNGLLLDEDFEFERISLEHTPNMLVLTDFTHLNLLEDYELEKLCYEIWRCGAVSRGLAKGAKLKVSNKSAYYYQEVRSKELNELITSFDKRTYRSRADLSGTVFEGEIDPSSVTLFPVLNVQGVDISESEFLLDVLTNEIGVAFSKPNYIPIPSSTRTLLKTHGQFESKFKKKHDVSLKGIILLVSSLAFRYTSKAVLKESIALGSVLLRGYEGISTKEQIIDEAEYYLEGLAINWEIQEVPTRIELERAFDFLTLQDQNKLRFLFPGTQKLFLPATDEHFFIDYSVFLIIVNSILFGIDLDKFSGRGELLEIAVSSEESFLPTTPCKSKNKSSKQIDYSILIEDSLIILECKVVAMPVSFHYGDVNSINYRINHVIKRGLNEVDEKAKWLKQNPSGTNYNLDGVKRIVAIVVSPFEEFIHSKDEFYWLTDEYPRVLSINEIERFIEEFDTGNNYLNTVFL